MDQKAFLSLLAAAVQHGASDIHLHPGMSPGFRLRGDLVNVKGEPLTEADFQTIVQVLFHGKEMPKDLSKVQDHDGSFEVKNLSRFRYNLFRYKGRLGVILRIIPADIPTIEKLGLPSVLKKIAEVPRGLVLVTGATGSGKSSTLAAMIDHINGTSPCHILTIEDPIEFLHPNKKSRLSQREVGSDTGSFAHALRAALRQDPDVILVGEMRDPETIDVALKAAETGHLVFSTVHTNDAIKTIGRLISVFPPEEQRMVRTRLADNLMATISQRLIKRADGKGSIAAQEIMISNKGIAECISDPDKTHEINDFITKSRELSGGQTFDQHLSELFLKKLITRDAAMENATSPADFERNLMYGGNPGAETGNADNGKRRTPPPPNRKAPENDGPTSSQVVVLEGMGRDKEKKGA
jgi:twitching motility protein PilT